MARKKASKGAAIQRDLKTADSGVPRGDWSDDPLQADGGGEGARSDVDGHFTGRESAAEDTEDRAKSED